MRHRHRESKRTRRKTFGRTADRTHRVNVRARPMRGGTRL